MPGPDIERAVQMQAANVQQKAMLDMTMTKLVMAMNRSRKVGPRSTKAELQAAIDDMQGIFRMTRDECAAARAGTTIEYPDEQVQAILTRGVNEITDVILGAE